MSRRTTGIVLVLACLAATVISLAYAYARLPARVASHFNGAGQPDGWMTRGEHVVWMAGVGLGLPLALLLLFWSLRFLPASTINVPNKDYWLAPERRAQTSAYLFDFGIWFVLLQGLFFLAIHWLVFAANRQPQAQLS